MAEVKERVFQASPAAYGGGRVLASPFQFFTTGEEHLRVQTVNSASGVRVALHYRFLSPERGIIANAEQHTPNTDRTLRASLHRLGAGALLNLTVFAEAGAPRVGQTFVRVQLVRGFDGALVVMGTLLQGYITANQDLAFPGSPIQSSLDTTGCVRSIVGTNPAAGNEWSETVPTGALWQLLSASVLLTTDGTAVDRQPLLQLLIASELYFRSPVEPVIGASTNGQISWFPGALYPGTFTGGASPAPLPNATFLPAGSVISSATVGLTAGDNYSAPRLMVREWLEVQ